MVHSKADRDFEAGGHRLEKWEGWNHSTNVYQKAGPNFHMVFLEHNFDSCI